MYCNHDCFSHLFQVHDFLTIAAICSSRRRHWAAGERCSTSLYGSLCFTYLCGPIYCTAFKFLSCKFINFCFMYYWQGYLLLSLFVNICEYAILINHSFLFTGFSSWAQWPLFYVTTHFDYWVRWLASPKSRGHKWYFSITVVPEFSRILQCSCTG